MQPTSVSIVRIKAGTKPSGLTKAQQQFNTLIKKIDGQKQRLAAWQENIPKFQQLVNSKYIPLMQTFSEHQQKMVYLLDKLYDSARLSRKEKEKLGQVICSLCIELIRERGKDELKLIFDKYSEFDFDTPEKETEIAGLTADMIKSILERELGTEIDEDLDVNNPEKVAAFIEEHRARQQAQAEMHQTHRKKTLNQLKKEALLQAEEERMSKSIQAVYRQLVSSLHPDREPDSAERARKTELMQRVNAAYEKEDLLQLLELQLTLDQIDQSNIDSIAADRLKYYNQILKRQLEQLQQQVADIEFFWKQQAGAGHFESLSPLGVLQRINEDIKNLRKQIANLKEDLVTFKDGKFLKAWLKHYQIIEEEMEFI